MTGWRLTATGEHGLAAPSGIISPKGMGGLTCGGRLGPPRRSCGLSIDNLLEAGVVLARAGPAATDGEERVRASYRRQHDRLAKVRCIYHPDRLKPEHPCRGTLTEADGRPGFPSNGELNRREIPGAALRAAGQGRERRDAGTRFGIAHSPAEAVVQAALEVLGLKVLGAHPLAPRESALIIDDQYAWHAFSFLRFSDLG
jgi:FAD/FMN-containing dehydrogenase